MSSTREPPIPEQHHSFRFRQHFTHDRRILAERMRLQRPQCRTGLLLRHDCHELAFVRDLERLETQDLTRAAYRFADWNALFVQYDRKARAGGDLVQRAGHAAARGILDYSRAGRGSQKCRHQTMQRGTVALDVCVELERLAREHDRDAVVRDEAAHEHDIPRLHAVHAQRACGTHHTHAAGVDEHLVRLAAIHHLRIARDDGHARLGGGRSHGVDHAAKDRHVEPLLQDQPNAECEGTRARDREVIDGAMHGKPADVAAGKEERAHDVAVGGQRDALPAGRTGEHCRIRVAIEQRIAERRQDDRLEQCMTRLAAAAVAQRHVFVPQPRCFVAHDPRPLHAAKLRGQRRFDAACGRHPASTGKRVADPCFMSE